MVGMRKHVAAQVLFNHQVAAQLGLSAREMQFLNLLDVYGPLTAGQLSELTGLSTGSVTGVLDRVEEAGYARRTRDPADRRKVVVMLDGDRIEREVVPRFAPMAEQLSAAIADRDVADLHVIADFLHRLIVGGGPRAPGRTSP
jgi:DNA-binding MarR family transcriptional regulator